MCSTISILCALYWYFVWICNACMCFEDMCTVYGYCRHRMWVLWVPQAWSKRVFSLGVSSEQWTRHYGEGSNDVKTDWSVSFSDRTGPWREMEQGRMRLTFWVWWEAESRVLAGNWRLLSYWGCACVPKEGFGSPYLSCYLICSHLCYQIILGSWLFFFLGQQISPCGLFQRSILWECVCGGGAQTWGHVIY